MSPKSATACFRKHQLEATLETNGFLTDDEFQKRLTELKGKRFPILSKGGVTLIDVLGSERYVVNAARTTSDAQSKGEKDDVNLIRYLMRHRHGTPFEFVEMIFKIEIPMDAWRQMIRHRTASVNEFSSRYSDVPDINDVTPIADWRVQSTSNRQGSGGMISDEWPPGYKIWPIAEDGDPILAYEVSEDLEKEYQDTHREWGVFQVDDEDKLDDCLVVFTDTSYADLTPGAYLSARETEHHLDARDLYAERLDSFNIAKEQARKDLPLSTYTVAWWKCDMRNILGFLSLRMDGHAQKEIRDYANKMGEIVAQLYPVLWDAFRDYDLNSLKMTALDIEVVQRLSDPDHKVVVSGDAPWSWTEFLVACRPHWRDMTKNRERNESWAKLLKLGLVAGEIPLERRA